MLFNTLDFAKFLPIIFFLHWFFASKYYKRQNIVLLLASYFFYASWDWRFLFLLIFSTLLDFYTGIKMSESENQKTKKFWFWLSISINIGFLGIFKYLNFFIDTFIESFKAIGYNLDPFTLQIILPVGISFYTFHGLSYVIDIYNDKIKPERNFIDYSLFVSFFPLLVAGPIERANHLLPQLKKVREFNYLQAVSGLKQILWGLFKKVVIADQCAIYANMTFNNSNEFGGSTLVLGAVFFAIQIYGDFSGYSDIALGVAKLFGIDLLKNFNFPYFSRDIAEFWRRWHISLSSWFKDYLYIPLGGSKAGRNKSIINTFIIFLVSGFWHGANFTFIIWGLLNALFIMPAIIFQTNRNNLEIVAKNRSLPTLKELLSIIKTFGLTVFAWIFFRSESLNKAIDYLLGIFNKTLFSMPTKPPLIIISFAILFFIVEWIGRESNFALEKLGNNLHKSFRYVIYYLIIASIIVFSGSKQSFIYFQF